VAGRRAYTKIVIQARSKELPEAIEGESNDTLNRCAFVDEETVW
jgi:hypothetical protein